jgi:hypothetical protein
LSSQTSSTGRSQRSPMRSLSVICDMKRRRRRLGRLYSGFFAKKRVSRVIVAIDSGQSGDIRSQVVAFPPGGVDESQIGSDRIGGVSLLV